MRTETLHLVKKGVSFDYYKDNNYMVLHHPTAPAVNWPRGGVDYAVDGLWHNMKGPADIGLDKVKHIWKLQNERILIY